MQSIGTSWHRRHPLKAIPFRHPTWTGSVAGETSPRRTCGMALGHWVALCPVSKTSNLYRFNQKALCVSKVKGRFGHKASRGFGNSPEDLLGKTEGMFQFELSFPSRSSKETRWDGGVPVSRCKLLDKVKLWVARYNFDSACCTPPPQTVSRQKQTTRFILTYSTPHIDFPCKHFLPRTFWSTCSPGSMLDHLSAGPTSKNGGPNVQLLRQWTLSMKVSIGCSL